MIETKSYKNWKGKISVRHFVPIWTFFGFTKYHNQPQWLVWAWDVDKNAFRIFAKRDFINE
jgi:hypothetical protein